MHTSQGLGFPDSSVGKKNLSATQETPVQFLGQELTRNCLEKG